MQDYFASPLLLLFSNHLPCKNTYNMLRVSLTFFGLKGYRFLVLFSIFEPE
jgi:hypothetical protein